MKEKKLKTHKAGQTSQPVNGTPTINVSELALIPRDGFFAKDGRGWATSARAEVVDWPWPTTVRGALTTASGKQIERANNRFGPADWDKHHKAVKLLASLALRREHGATKWQAEHRMWPTPVDALWLENDDNVCRLNPIPADDHVPTLGRAASPAHPESYELARERLWIPQNVGDNAKPLPSPRWLDERTFVNWLRGETLKKQAGVAPIKAFAAMERRLQVHVGIRSETATADDGILFAHDVIETLEKTAEWAIGAKVEWPADKPPRSLRLGSDSRLAFVESTDSNLFRCPEDLTKGGKILKRFRLIVVTPTSFTHGWLPDGFKPHEKEPSLFRGELGILDNIELILRAALVPRPMHISGWDMNTGGPKNTERLVPPGSVYFFEVAGNTGDLELSGGQGLTIDQFKSLWLAKIGGRTDDGMGCVVPGLWP
jgi:CRISPR-associated protein Cmr3